HFVEPADNGVGVIGIDFDPIAAPPGLFCCDQGGAAAGKDVENDATTLGAIENRVGYQGCRLNRRLHGKFGVAILAKAVYTRLIPDIAAMATKAPQFEVVDVLSAAVLEHENQFMLRPVKASHTGIGLRPDTKVFEFAVWLCGRLQKLADMAPIDADKMYRAIGAELGETRKGRLEKLGELIRAHLTGCHGEFAMLHLAKA